jgi:hypothetical protein
LNIQNTTQFSSTPLILPAKGSVSVLQRKTTTYLPRGAQGQLIDAAVLAEKLGHPINQVTTIRTEILSRSSVGVFASKHEADGVSGLLELMRKWHIKRSIPWVCIWSREVGQIVGGHIHIGTHQSKEHIEGYIDQLPHWTGEDRIFLEKHKPGDIGFSENGSWLVQCCMRKGESGTDVAAYLGKDEQGRTVTGWGVERINASKRTFTHPCHGGYVEGTSRTAYRHGTSRNIAPLTAKGRKALETISDSERLISDLSWLPY